MTQVFLENRVYIGGQQEPKTERKKITKLPDAWPLKGMIRGDFGGYIILAHPDRHPHISKDGKSWIEVAPAALSNPEVNRVISGWERERWAR